MLAPSAPEHLTPCGGNVDLNQPLNWERDLKRNPNYFLTVWSGPALDEPLFEELPIEAGVFLPAGGWSPGETYRWKIEAHSESGSTATECTFSTVGSGNDFRRGDGDGSGGLTISDPIINLTFQFLGGVIPVCRDALDTDDSGTITINDPIRSLTFQFLGGTTIPLPGPGKCGPDPTDDNEDCEAYPQDKCQP